MHSGLLGAGAMVSKGGKAQKKAAERLDQLVAGRFTLERALSAEALRTVYRAYDHAARSTVTLETVDVVGGQSLDAFRRDAAAIAAVDHEGIARVFAHGVTEDGMAWMASEWVEGESLAKRLERGPLDLVEGFTLSIRLAAALAASHARGVVHGALHASCVLLPGGRVDGAKIAGFGRAALDASMAASGAHAVRPCYVAPEQARGAPEADTRVDVFALGCLLHHAFLGAPPFGGGDNTVARMAKVLFEDAPRIRSVRLDVPGPLDEAIARMLTRERADRPADGIAAEALLEAARSGAEDTCPPTQSPDRPSGVALHDVQLASVVVALRAWVDGEAALERARAAASRYGARVERLIDGSIVSAI